MVKKSQSEVLEKYLQREPEKKPNLDPLIWSVETYPQGTFILGDLGPVAAISESIDLQAPLKAGSSLEYLFLPVSSQYILIGKKEAGCRDFTPDEINTASVELSREFFVSDSNTEREMNYSLKLGKRSSLLTEKEMQELMKAPLAKKN
jgi:hypothetical protein